MALLECIPNVSEGRRVEVFDRLTAAVGSVAGVRLLDRSRDADHHRSVFTLAGEVADLIEGLLALYEVAVAEIDLTRHRGAHPRVGAVDVVPFVPLGATPMAAAVAAAMELGERVAERFELPVYLYEEAAASAYRRRLPDIRRGGFEGFFTKIADPRWTPDFGPSRVHPTAGVTVIGARFFLIALNAVLDTPDVEVARRIAAAVRESSGGLPAVRALGLFLAGRRAAQVSMNLVDYRRTSPARALERVEAEAAALGARVVEIEFIGLPPEEAVAGGIRLPGFDPESTLERRLRGD